MIFDWQLRCLPDGGVAASPHWHNRATISILYCFANAGFYTKLVVTTEKNGILYQVLIP
ncbi:hypothetical protein [Nostoc sp. C110]|uniref:hypothetical protein n=1 Tax=Nostoc sp. C110 TaxID=3349876 RepID=UPI00370D38EA